MEREGHRRSEEQPEIHRHSSQETFRRNGEAMVRCRRDRCRDLHHSGLASQWSHKKAVHKLWCENEPEYVFVDLRKFSKQEQRVNSSSDSETYQVTR